MTPKPITHLAPPNGGRFAAIIFDMGGTLLEFENVPWDALYPSSVHSLHHWIERQRIKAPPYDEFLERFLVLLERRRARIRAEMREYHITPLVRELLARFSITLQASNLSRAVDAYYAPIRRQVSVFPESKPTLNRLSELGYTIGLLSNTPFRVQDHREELVHHGLWQHFDATLFTSTIKFRKPHPEPFKLICRRLGVSPKRSLYVGDRQLEDVQGPQAVGMSACLIRRHNRKYQDGLTRSAEIQRLDELLGLLNPD
jgi:HAD superfamily hydrolase (TIGR01662 family)